MTVKGDSLKVKITQSNQFFLGGGGGECSTFQYYFMIKERLP